MPLSAPSPPLRLLVKPAEDVTGQWVGHCLELDILSVGTSPEHAIAMTREAVSECVADDLRSGRDPFARRPAPDESFEEWQRGAERRYLDLDFQEFKQSL